MKRLTIVLAGLIGILFATPAPAQTPMEQARAFQVNTAHTGWITSPGLAPLRQTWSINFGNFITVTGSDQAGNPNSDSATVRIN